LKIVDVFSYSLKRKNNFWKANKRTLSKHILEKFWVIEMNVKKFSILIGILLIAALVIGSMPQAISASDTPYLQDDPRRPMQPPVTTPPTYSKGIAKIETEKITVAVTADGMVLHFLFWNTSDPSIVYHAKFVQMMEYIDSNGDGIFQYNEMVPASVLAVSAIDFSFSGFENITDNDGNVIGIKFSFNSTNVSDVRQSNLELDVVCYLFFEDSEINGIAVNGLTELKFTIVIKNWKWVRDDSDLVVRFDLTWSNTTDKPRCRANSEEVDMQKNMEGNEKKLQSRTQNKYRCMELVHDKQIGYFDYVSTAIADGQTVSTNASYATYGDLLRVYFTYPHFENELIHDPIIGIASETEEAGDLISQYIPTDYLTISIIVIVVIIVAIVVKKIRS